MGSPRRDNDVSGVITAPPVVSFAREGTIFADAIQTAEDDRANHHLWQNGRLWWVAFTIHRPDWTKHRIRLSLKTADLAEARRRRDYVLEEFRRRGDCRLSVRLPRGA